MVYELFFVFARNVRSAGEKTEKVIPLQTGPTPARKADKERVPGAAMKERRYSKQLKQNRKMSANDRMIALKLGRYTLCLGKKSAFPLQVVTKLTK